MRSFYNDLIILDGVGAAGIGAPQLVADWRHKEIEIATNGMGAGDNIVVKIQGSSSIDMPDFSAAQSATNKWDYVQVIDQENGDPIDGDTGIPFADADEVRNVRVNVDGLRWINVVITTLDDETNTTVTAKLSVYND